MGKIITFAQQKGGAGKTTVLAHLADAWARAGHKVALIDLDPQRSLSQWAGLYATGGLDLVESRDWRAGPDIRAAAKSHDRVLVDCPGNAEGLLSTAIGASDLVVVPCQPSPLDVWATGAILKLATAEKRPARVLLNRVAPRGTAADQTAQELTASGGTVLRTRLGNRVAFGARLLAGQTALSDPPSSRARQEAEALAAELDSLLRG